MMTVLATMRAREAVLERGQEVVAVAVVVAKAKVVVKAGPEQREEEVHDAECQCLGSASYRLSVERTATA